MIDEKQSQNKTNGQSVEEQTDQMEARGFNAEYQPKLVEMLEREMNTHMEREEHLNRLIDKMKQNKLLEDFAEECWRAFVPILQRRY